MTELLGIAGAALSGLLAVIVALIGVVYRNDQKALDAWKSDQTTRTVSLEKQNTEQETRIATLIANERHAERNDSRLLAALDRLDSTQVAIQQELSLQRGVLTELSRRLTGSAGMPAVKLPPRGGE